MKNKVFKQGFIESPYQKTLFKPFETEGAKITSVCAACGRQLSDVEPKYCLSFTKKGTAGAGIYCQPCAKKKLRPQEETAEL